MADPEVWQALLNTGNPYWHEQQRQKGLAGMLELEKMQRGLEQEKNLQELFARSANPSVGAVGAISPQFATEYGKSRFEQQRMQQQLNEENYKQNAAIFGPIAERAKIREAQGVKDWQGMFNNEMGDAARQIVESGGMLPNNFNAEMHDPMHVLTNAIGFGYKSPFMESMMQIEQERAKRSIPPQMSPQQYYGEQHTTPEGYVTRTPGMGGQPQIRQAPAQMPSQPSMGQEDVTEQQLISYIESLPEGPEKQRLQSVIAQGKSMAPGSTSAVEISPEELANIRKFRKAEEAKAVETAKLEANKEQTVKQREEILSSIPSRDEVENLIDKSISSGVEQQLKGKIGPAVGMGSEALTATKQLDVIAPQLKSITKTLAGAGAISDFEQKMMADAAGAIADPNVPADARKAAFRTFMDIMDKADKSAKPAQGGLPRPKTAAEARALPKGTQFIDPNGVVRINE